MIHYFPIMITPKSKLPSDLMWKKNPKKESKFV